MAALDFHPSKYSFEELLNRRYYQIPRFQRPYSWDSGNLEEFWRDSIEDNDLGYFIGPMVGWSRGEESSIAYVVDGQQRITTISILLSEIRSQFQLLGEERLARGIQRLLERPDRDNEDRFVLQTEDQSPYLNRRILAYPADTTVRPASSNEEGLEGARAWLSARVEKLLTPDGVRMEKADAIGALKDVRDRILALRVIWVNLGNEDDAYIVFETLNSRGKDLAVADLLKNHLLNRIRARNLRADAAREKWDRMRRTLDESSPPIDADRYIQHWWLSQEDYVAQRKLFRAIREKVRTKEQAQERLDSIVNDAPLYRLILEPTSDEWGPEEEAIRDALTGLALFGVTQPAPLLLSMLRARKNGDARLKQLTPSFKAIERFHFQSTVIVGQSSSGGVSAMYARYARALARSESPEARAESLRKCREYLKSSTPDGDVFKAAFPERFLFTNQLTRDKKLVQYALRRLHESSREHRPRRPSLEHLMSQEEIKNGASPGVVGNIGNLFYFDEDLNQRLNSKPFLQKRAILEEPEVRSLYDVEDVIDKTSWGPEEIKARGARLAEKALQGPWSLAGL